MKSPVPFSITLYLKFYFMFIFSLRICLCTTCVPGALGDQKKVLDPLKLELQMVANHLWVL